MPTNIAPRFPLTMADRYHAGTIVARSASGFRFESLDSGEVHHARRCVLLTLVDEESLQELHMVPYACDYSTKEGRVLLGLSPGQNPVSIVGECVVLWDSEGVS